MEYSTGKLAFIFLAAVALSVTGAWLLGWRFRVAMRALTSTPVATDPAAAPAVELPNALPPPAAVSAADNRHAGLRLALLLVMLSAVLALSSAALQLGVELRGEFDAPLSPARLATLAFVHLWPVIPALALMWRWTRRRTVGVLLLWFVLAFVVVWWRSTAQQPLPGLLLFLAGEIGPAMLLVALLCMGNTTRAVAPWLLPPMVGLVWASVAGIDLLELLVRQRSPALGAVAGALGANTVMLLAALLPWLVAWWPLKALARGLAAGYARRWLSELMVLFTAVWGISLLFKALGAASSLGVSGIVMLLPLAWIPLALLLWPHLRLRRRDGRPPTLLVLRVFQRDRAMRLLFDEVIERWRLSGNTVLIAGTDLLDRTLDAGDIFDFVDGRLAERFVRRRADIAPRLAAFELEPDADGRHRVNECYCHDSTWRETLAALLARSDVVLMDLRGFQHRNEGCRHELGELARAARLARVVLLVDGQTDRASAQAASAVAPPGRFEWIDSARIDATVRRHVLHSLLAAT